MTNVLSFRKPSLARLACIRCGAETDAACNCGVEYKPAGTRAAEAIAQNPEKSDRAIAAEIGVAPNTVRTARKSTAQSCAVEKRIGKDGKARKLPAKSDPTPLRVDCRIIDPEHDSDEGDRPEKIWCDQFDYRSKEALRMATESLDDLKNLKPMTITDGMFDKAIAARDAWTRLIDAMGFKDMDLRR